MLNFFRRSAKSFIIKVLLILLALSFMVWGVGNYIDQRNQLPVVEADGWAIGPLEFSQAYDQEFRRLRERFGGSLDKKTAEMLGLKMRTLNALINRHLLLKAGSDMHLTVSPEVLRRRIASTPAFQSEGTFSKERYELLLRSNRLTPVEFESQLTADIVSEQIRRTAGTLAVLPKVLAEDIYQLENEKRTAATLSLKPKDLEESIQTPDDELLAYMKKNSQRFMTKAKVKLKYAVLNTDSVRDAVTVTEEEIKEFYNEHNKEYQRAETRSARHILVKVDDKTTSEAAMEKIKQAQERLKGGESFEDVAKALSEDASAGQGGDLGEFGRGVMVGAFETVAFALETGKISDPVTTEYGIHLIRVDKINPAEIKPLESVATEIKTRIVESKAKDLVYERSSTFEDQLAASGALQTIAKDLQLTYKETDWMARDESGRSGVELEPKFLESAFSLTKGAVSTLIELSNGQFVALEVTDRQEPTPQTLDQARDAVVQAFKEEKAKEDARKIMGDVVKALNEGKPVEELAAMHAKIQSVTTNPFAQDGQEKEPGAKTKDVVFKLLPGKPNHPDIIEDEGRLVAVRLLKVVEAPQEGFKDAEKELVKKLEESIGMEQLTAYLNGLWKNANIKINHDVLDRL
ncbi:MAG: SurA N-terminal domain-containing protein [Magnetococcus sp. YQC-5]